MTYILCIETSTNICSVAVAKDKKLIAQRETAKTFSHSEVIALFVQECLKEAAITTSDLSAVAISGGPGSYTALRIGASTAKGICFVEDIPLIAVNSLTALAQHLKTTVREGEVIIPLLDARRMEVYYSVFDHELNILQETEPKILTTDSFLDYKDYKIVHFLGDGAEKFEPVNPLKGASFHKKYSTSSTMIDMVFDYFAEKKFENLAYYEPFYFKPPNITVQKKNILR